MRRTAEPADKLKILTPTWHGFGDKQEYRNSGSMEQSPSSNTNRFSDSQEIPHMLCSPNVHYRTHKCPSPLPILSQLNPVHAFPSTSCRSIIILLSHLRLGLPSTYFPHIPHQNPLCRFPVSHSCHMPLPSHSSLFAYPNNIWWGVKCKGKGHPK